MDNVSKMGEDLLTRILALEGNLSQGVNAMLQRQAEGVPNPSFVAFGGRSHRVRSPTPTPPDRAGRTAEQRQGGNRLPGSDVRLSRRQEDVRAPRQEELKQNRKSEIKGNQVKPVCCELKVSRKGGRLALTRSDWKVFPRWRRSDGARLRKGDLRLTYIVGVRWPGCSVDATPCARAHWEKGRLPLREKSRENLTQRRQWASRCTVWWRSGFCWPWQFW